MIADDREEARSYNPVLIQSIAKGFLWLEALKREPTLSLRSLAERAAVDVSVVSRAFPLAFLAPDIVETLIEGRQPADLTAKALVRMDRLPFGWVAQRQILRTGTC